MATGILEWMVETAFLLSFFLVWLYAETLLDIYPYGVWRGVFFPFLFWFRRRWSVFWAEKERVRGKRNVGLGFDRIV